MRNKKILLLLLPFLLSGCDDGRIYPTDIDLSGDSGITVVMTGEISGSSDSYESGYSLVLAAFNESDDYAIVSKTVHDGSDSVELSNVSPKASTIELCLINSLRKSLHSAPYRCRHLQVIVFHLMSGRWMPRISP